MFLVISFLILEYVASKINGKNQIRQIESDFKSFKLAATKDDFILNAVERLYPNEATCNITNELLHAPSITGFIGISEKYRIPIQRILYEWNYVPGQDSPKHILNVLYNECIQEMLRKLTDTGDFLSAAETCHHFQENALQCYPKDFKYLHLSIENRPGSEARLSLRIAPDFLKKFGYLIRGLTVEDFDVRTLKMIAKYCSSTLYEMTIKGQENRTKHFYVLSQFKVLKFLVMHSISIDNIELPENLVYLHMTDVKCQTDLQCFKKKFPKLKVVFLYGVDNLNDTAFNAFIQLNPQIESLIVLRCPNLTSAFCNRISDRLPNLTELSVGWMEPEMTILRYNEIVMHLSQMQELKYLDIIIHHQHPANILISSLAANVPTIETLHLSCFDFEQAIPQLLQLKHIKELSFIGGRDIDFSVNAMVELFKGLTALKKIQFDRDTISVSEITDILEYSENLTELRIWIRNMNMDLSDYNSILASIKGQVVVELTIDKGNIDENIFQKNEKRLKIKIYSPLL